MARTGQAVGSGRLRRRLTAAEEELWLIEQENPADPAYLVPFAVWVDGPLHVPVLERALRQVVARHDILRTVFRSADGAPFAEVLPFSAVPCPVSVAASDAEVLARAGGLAGQPFAPGELRLRAAVLRVHASRWLFVLVLHHAICDFASLWVLLGELAALYTALIAGRETDLPEPVQFAQACAADLADSGAADRLAATVADAVRSAPDLVSLPFDQPSNVAGPTRGSLLRMALPARLNDATERTARRLAVSPNAVLLAAYAVLLDVIAGADDVLVSVPVSRRSSPAEQRVIGFLVHSVPVRLRTDECASADELIRHAWAALRQGRTQAGVSFGRVVAEVNPERVPGRNPLCQCEFSAQELPDRLPEFGQARLTYQFVHNGGCKFSLSLEVVRSAGARAIAIEYPAAVFRATTVRRLANLYLRVLTAVTADATGQLADLDLVSRAELAWLAEHGGGEPDGPQRRPVPGLAGRIEQVIRIRPADEAVRAAGRSLTYAELGQLSGALAAALRAAGTAEGHRVAVFADRETEAVVAVTGVIRLGASFVMIADDTPAERVASILAAARPTVVVVTSPRLLGALPERWRASATRYSDGWLAADHGNAGHGDSARCPGEAYLVFTSGSTGEPRGVSVPTEAIAAITGAWGAEFGLAAQPGRHLQLAPFSFDVFVGDLARSLCFGGTLVLAARIDVLDPRRLTGLVRRERIDTVELVPAVARLLSDFLEQAGQRLPGLRRVMVGSDFWPAADAQRLHALLPEQARLYCTYGTSEAAVDATFFRIEPARPLQTTVVPIGSPFPGVLVSVRDRLGRLLPPRCPGELWIGGATVATGYLSAGDQAADRFRLARAPDGRMCRWYRTGDCVVWDDQGSLNLLGRLDSETKIRGVRVHPAEIEAVLCQHPAVTAAAVVAVGDPAHRTLVAFVAGPAEAERDELAAYARRNLLPVVVPARFSLLERMPTTRHGKVDRRALAGLAQVLAAPRDERVEPTGELEQAVAAICAEVLALPGIGATDNLYALGASSVHVARLAWRLSAAAGRQVSVREVIGAPSVRELCQAIEDHTEPGRADPGTDGPGAIVVAVSPPDASARAAVPARRVVLTGPTGNLGPGLLRELLAADVDEVVCLVRADDPAHAEARVRAALARYGADPDLAGDPRVRYLAADLSQPDAGLSAAGAVAVTHADAVVNAAARVSFLYPYELLVPVNVQGVATLARLAGQFRLAALHHLSTRSAVPASGRAPAGGYNQSKAGAERLLARYRELGLPVSVYRPGFVLGRIATRPSRPGFLESFLRECLRVGSFPVLPGHLNVVSADHIATRVVGNVLSRDPADSLDLMGSAPLPWPEAWRALRDHGVRLAEASPGDWLRLAAERRADESWLEPFLQLCQSVGLPELLSDEASDPAGKSGVQPVAQAWQQICAQLARLADSAGSSPRPAGRGPA